MKKMDMPPCDVVCVRYSLHKSVKGGGEMREICMHTHLVKSSIYRSNSYSCLEQDRM